MRSLFLSMLWVGCAFPPSGGSSDTAASPEPTTDVRGLGNIVLDLDVDSGVITADAIFVDSAPFFANLAACASTWTGCVVLPVEEAAPLAQITTQPYPQNVEGPEAVGDPLRVGPYTLPFDEATGAYHADLTDSGLTTGWLGLSLGGAWPSYTGTADLFVPTPIATSLTGQTLGLASGSPAPIVWEPTGDGTVILTLTFDPEIGVSLLYALDDDGSFDLDADDVASAVGLTETGQLAIAAELSRWRVEDEMIGASFLSNVAVTHTAFSIVLSR